ncbi:hypothetical protein D6D04_09406, partial [Aureobasidium pullulans]
GGECGNALYAASYYGYGKIVQLLLDKGADVNAKGGHYVNALQAASVRGHDKTVQLLLERQTPELGYRDLTNRCLDLGAKVEATDKYGETALHYAAENGHLNIVKKLAQANVHRTALNYLGRTALDCARGGGPGDGRSSYPDIVAYL